MMFCCHRWIGRWIHRIDLANWTLKHPRQSSECWLLKRRYRIMQKYEKLEKIGEGMVRTFPAFVHECRVLILIDSVMRGNFFFTSLSQTIRRYLWDRFQSKTQRNARDSSAETSTTWRGWWGKYYLEYLWPCFAFCLHHLQTGYLWPFWAFYYP